MPSKSEWEEAYKRLKQGESYGDVAEWLGVSKSGLYERHERHLKGKVEKQKAELQEVVEGKEEMEGEFQDIEERYQKKKEEEEKKLAKSLKEKKEELENIKSRIGELKKKLKDRGLTIEDALNQLKKLGRLEDEVEKLGQRKNLWRRFVERKSAGRKT
ncbi:hypothetical protein AKJ65_05765 [candidate division MSBL1 archaeon SCGC-AAA259E19]|uniref:Uncharacterized protein n=1 Tax=candidate division MSBL1 archaeon SCGC-AAA259E19 TaxID=1698264 RepID=A0A133UIA7_9EURY|nr:hypothetical protein AKJ65_05765 [candidate division MSBL1 archaeon SCGC-AAA259E19]